MEINSFIKVYDNVIQPETLSRLLGYINTLKFEEAKINTKGTKHIVDRNVRRVEATSLNRSLDNLSTVH